ncbi:MAG: hypothetical protein AAF206_25470 [Bacteroidota bacterium]
MKPIHFVLIVFLFQGSIRGQGQTYRLDTTIIRGSKTSVLHNADRLKGLPFGQDSIYLFQFPRQIRSGHHSRRAYYLTQIGENLWCKVAINLPKEYLEASDLLYHRHDVSYLWQLADFGDSTNYLLIHWYYSGEEEKSSVPITSGPESPICGQQIHSQKRDYHGIRIIDPTTHTLLFESLIEAEHQTLLRGMGRTSVLKQIHCQFASLNVYEKHFRVYSCRQSDFFSANMLPQYPPGQYHIKNGKLVWMDE